MLVPDCGHFPHQKQNFTFLSKWKFKPFFPCFIYLVILKKHRLRAWDSNPGLVVEPGIFHQISSIVTNRIKPLREKIMSLESFSRHQFSGQCNSRLVIYNLIKLGHCFYRYTVLFVLFYLKRKQLLRCSNHVRPRIQQLAVQVGSGDLQWRRLPRWR